MITDELRSHAAGLVGAADATELPALRARLLMAAEVMENAAKHIERGQMTEDDIPAFLRKNAR